MRAGRNGSFRLERIERIDDACSRGRHEARDDSSQNKDSAPAENLAMSKARANSVKDYLITTGVHAQSIEVEAYGDSKPLVYRRTSFADESVDSQNRRVELGLK